VCETIQRSSSKPFHELSFEGYIESEHQGEKPRYFRIGTREGENGESQFPSMYQNCIASIGWPDLENLYEFNEIKLTGIRNRLLELGYCRGDRGAATRKAKEILLFLNEIRHNDYVLAADGVRVLAIGRVVGDHYVYDENLNFPHCRCVKWIIVEPKLTISEGLRTTVYELNQKTSIDSILQHLNSETMPNDIAKPMFTYQSADHPLNRILYGPPGTGKTYQSISYAVAAVDNRPLEEVLRESETEEGRSMIKERFDALLESGNIVFTTFHQNMGYEDFIEGIRPLEPMPGQPLQYGVVPGIFKRLCESAEEFLLPRTQSSNKKLSFEDALEALQAEWNSNNNLQFELTRANKAFTISQFGNNRIPFRKASGGTAHSLSIRTLKGLYNGTRTRLPGGIGIYYTPVLEKLKKYASEDELTDENLNNKPDRFVLIIDEINRGNVSQIFGELITLIEADKRQYAKESIALRLPYSEDEFSVPPNVFILGTMNTADRSVEALDTALRRRFSFLPMMPDENKLKVTEDGINLPAILATLNKRLRVLKDNDHTIGHAWFWNVQDLAGLQQVFANKVLPLLQEYFYNDYEKLGLLLGDTFFEKQEQVSSNIFANFSGGNGLAGQYEQSWQFELKAISVLTIDDFKTLEQ
jgi:hypothetical protein